MDWIKMRGSLLDHPKVVAMARKLRENPAFIQWLMPGYAGNVVVMAGEPAAVTTFPDEVAGKVTISHDHGASTFLQPPIRYEVLRSVTLGALLKLWSSARAHGKFDGEDLVLAHSSHADIDEMAGLPGLAAVMKEVGWLTNGRGITLPKFKRFNVPMSHAERQAAYRERHGVTRRDEKVTQQRHKAVTRGEESKSTTARTKKPGARHGGKAGSALTALKPSSTESQNSTPSARATENSQKTPLQEACALTWAMYAAGYEKRWGVEPARSAVANAHVKGFCERIPMADAPLVAAWFCTHPRAAYVSAQHDLALLRRDATGLHTQWRTHNVVTDTRARQDERTAARGQVFNELIEEGQHGKKAA